MSRIHSNKNIFPFCAGLGCGMILSLLLFLPITSRYLYSQLVRSSGKEKAIEFDYRDNIYKDDSGLIRERKESKGERGQKLVDNHTIPIEVDPDPTPIESLDWDLNVASQRIPAYLSKELKFKRKLFVGVITVSPLMAKISNLVPRTWGESWRSEGNGDMTFYSSMGVDVSKTSEYNYMSISGSPVLPDLPTPQMMYQVLRDICSQYIDTHHFYFIVNGNSYISLPDLLNFTMQLNESEPLWIGHGTYRPHGRRFFTNDPDYFCHSGPGFMLSRRSMQGVCPHLQVCEKLYSHSNEQPGYELARCFRRFLNINCTVSLEAQSFFYMSDLLPDPFLPSNPLQKSLTVHPVMDKTTLYVLHQYFIERQLNYTMRINEYYYSIVQNMDRVLVKEGGMPDDRLILGRDGNANKYHHPDIIAWTRIEEVKLGTTGETKNIVISANEQDPQRDATEHEDIVFSDLREITLQHLLEKYLSAEDSDANVDTGTVYRRVVPGVGFQYMVDVTKNNREVATVFVDQPYERVMNYGIRAAPDVKINFILPMQDGSPEFQEFMQMFEQACMSADQPQSVGLLVVLYTSSKSNLTDGKIPDEKSSQALSLLNLYKQKYPNLSLRWINAGTSSFSYMKAVEMAVLALPSETLICSLKLYDQMSPEFLHHIRLNTVWHERLFFPASFQFFKDISPETNKISHEFGFWRSFDYGRFCGYKQDIMQACGGDKFESGEELYKKSLQSGLDIFRAPEYALHSKWHETDCESTWLDSDERISCVDERKHTNLAVSAVR